MMPNTMPLNAVTLNQDADTDAALSLRGVSHRFGATRALKNVSLDIRAGEILCLVGPSGCGKSTLLRVAAGLENLQEGQIYLGGKRVAEGGARSVPAEKRGVGLVFQDYALFPHLSVLDNVRFGLARRKDDITTKRAMQVLEQVQMGDYADAFPHQLSGGQQQRVALARALAPSPKVLLLDEPFSGLDVRLRDKVRDDTLHILKQSGSAAMVVTHDPEEAMFLGDRLALLNQGELVQYGTPAELYLEPCCPFAAEFFGDVNRLAGEAVEGRVGTPLGKIDTPGIENGAEVDILIRPEAIQVYPLEVSLPGSVEATVETARLIGRYSLLHLTVCDEEDKVCAHIHARVPGVFLPKDDERIRVSVDQRQTFAFPR